MSGSAAAAAYTYESPTDQYLALRRSYPPVVGLTPGLVAQEPSRWIGHTLELSGRLSGIIRQEDGGAVLMLDSDRESSLTLPMSQLPYWLEPGERLRVLAVVTDPSQDAGDATAVSIGVASFQVVCVASASDIDAAELRWRQFAEARAHAQQAAMERAAAALAQAEAARGSAGLPGASWGLNAPIRPLGGLSSAALAVYSPYRDFIWRHNPRLTSTEADAITSSVLLFSERYDVDPRLVIALIIAESDFDPRSTSRKGAMGLGQLMPDEVHDLGLTNPYDPVQNVAGAVYLLRMRLDHYSGGLSSPRDLSLQSVVLALASYNAGMGAVHKYGGVPPYRETQDYVRKITRLYGELCAGDTTTTASVGGG